MSYDPVKFGGNWRCGSEDIKVLISHVISQNR